jgi:catechol 2,3-dioxygenase-like lactoylglutathione lyase family enzyme
VTVRDHHDVSPARIAAVFGQHSATGEDLRGPRGTTAVVRIGRDARRAALVLGFAALWYVLALLVGTALGQAVGVASGAEQDGALASVPRSTTDALAEYPRVTEVGPVEMTVSSLDRSVDFYTRVLGFRKLSEAEAWGGEVERVQGVFGARVRQARLALGDESIELTEYLAPRGRPRPAEARSNDRSFQHIAIIVSDMARAYRTLRQHVPQRREADDQRRASRIAAAADANDGGRGPRASEILDPGRVLPEGRAAARRRDLMMIAHGHASPAATAVARAPSRPRM